MSWKSTTVVLTTVLIPTLFATAAPDHEIKGIQRLANVQSKSTVFKAASRKKPLVLRSVKDAANYFSEEEMAKLQKKVDFDQQFVLVFAWRGSGQDRLEYSVLESYPEQIVFHYKPGRTRDLRPHVYIYALRKNVTWRTGAGDAKPSAPAFKESVRVKVCGKLNAEVAAIGGETTGLTITAKGITWELKFRSRYEHRMAQESHGKLVVVSGELNLEKGVEIKERWIVEVTSLQAAGASDSVGRQQSYLTDDVQLKHAIVLRDAQSGFAGESGKLLTIEKDGSWRRQPFLNETVREADLQGKLSEGHLKELASALTRYDLLGLPPRLGKPQGANPHNVTISFGQQERGMILRAGIAVPKPNPKQVALPEERFASVYHILQRVMASKKR